MKNNNFELANVFREELRNGASKDSIYTIYHHLFSFKTDAELEEELKYLYTLYKGTDSFFKKYSITEWFGIWHKSIRQTDYFENCYKESVKELVSDEERKEFKYLLSVVRKSDFDKRAGAVNNKPFNDTYNRYLDLSEIVKREKLPVGINGELDSILWNTIQLDNKDCLYKTFKYIFHYYEMLLEDKADNF